MHPSVLVCDIQRFCVHDGPGIRTTVFFKGCPLACRWCHNPETLSYKNELMISRRDCLACFDCVSACEHGAISIEGGRCVTDRQRCTSCLDCVEACPSGARSAASRAYGPDALLAEVVRDTPYFADGGGLTLSGGEPLSHVSFLQAFLPKVCAAGLHVVAQTAGHWSYAALASVLDHIDLLQFDVKAIDPCAHEQLTGRTNRRILSNLRRLVAEERAVEVRVPIVPDANDGARNLSATAQLPIELGLGRVTLLRYHRFGESKAHKLGQGADDRGMTLEPESMGRAADVFRSAGLRVSLG